MHTGLQPGEEEELDDLIDVFSAVKVHSQKQPKWQEIKYLSYRKLIGVIMSAYETNYWEKSRKAAKLSA